MRHLAVLALILTAGCGGSPTSPSPQPSPAPSPAPAPTFSGAVTDTVTGAPISGFSALLAGSRVTVSAPGYLTRETRNGDVDLIPEAAPFSLAFYRQFVRGALQDGQMEPLRRWTVAPSVYLQRAGFSDATVAEMESAVRQSVIGFTGGQFGVTTLESGPEARAPRAGWIVVSTDLETPGECGRSAIGGGEIHVSLRPICVDGYAVTNLAHEIGHALGFWHVPSGLMQAPAPRGMLAPSTLERYHASIAYKRAPGNRDVDSDPVSSAVTTRVVVD